MGPTVYILHVYVCMDIEEKHTKYLLDWQQCQEESYLSCEQKLEEIKVSHNMHIVHACMRAKNASP